MASSSHKKRKLEKENRRVLMEDVSEGNEWYPIPVINNFNNKTPKHFMYINSNSMSSETRKLTKVTGADGCECADGVCGANCVCERSSTVGFDPVHRIVPNPTSYDFYADFYVECGIHCGCRGKCKRQILPSNKVLKKLEAHWMEGKQYGILAAQPIAAGMPVVEYVGDVFVSEIEDDVFPPSHYQQEVLTDNEYNKFIIDARKSGNVARFINHSCFPNVLQICVYPSIPALKRSPPLPKVAIVALRDIFPGQELSFDYRAMYFIDRGIPCLCYEPNCHVPPRDHHEKSRTIEDVEKEVDDNKLKMHRHFDETSDIQPQIVDID